ncbi:MAG TPA: hypothetical protein DCQ06_06460, partial [Myxococcales bacterium]|nr:hypothetical protein [Myxococcales bacterium]
HLSVGLRADSTVQVSVGDYPDFPEYLDVLVFEGGRYYLAVPADSAARINLRGASNTDSVTTIRNKRCIPLDNIAGGSIVTGDLTVMFQFVRGYGAPTVTHERTVLRLGVVFDDRLILDRIFPEDKVVTVGGTKADTVVLDDDYTGLSLSFKNNNDGSVQLTAPSDMQVTAAVSGDQPRAVKELIQKGKARSEGSNTVAHLTLGSRGRATMGPYKLMFQVVRQRITVPTFEKKSPIQRVLGVFLQDVVWTACFSVAILLGLGVVAQALIYQDQHGQYLKQAKKAEEHVNETYEVEIEEKEEEPEPEEEEPKETAPELKPDPQPEPAKKAKPKKKAEPVKEAAKEKPQSTGKTVDPEERKRNARKVIAKNTIAGALMGRGGASTKLFAEGDGGEGEVVAKAFGSGGGDEGGDGPGGGVKLAGGGGGGGTVEKVKTGKTKGFGQRKKSVTKVKAKKKEKKIRVSLSAGSLGGSGAGKKGVGKVIARKSSAVRRCYEKALRKDSNLSGKVKVRFTVGTAGTITSVSVIGASGDFGRCIKTKFKRIRGLPLLPAPQSFTQSYVFTKS